MSYDHNVAAKPFFVVLVATTAETNHPEQEIAPGIRLLGRMRDCFVSVSNIYEPTIDGKTNNVSCIICESCSLVAELGISTAVNAKIRILFLLW